MILEKTVTCEQLIAVEEDGIEVFEEASGQEQGPTDQQVDTPTGPTINPNPVDPQPAGDDVMESTGYSVPESQTELPSEEELPSQEMDAVPGSSDSSSPGAERAWEDRGEVSSLHSEEEEDGREMADQLQEALAANTAESEGDRASSGSEQYAHKEDGADLEEEDSGIAGEAEDNTPPAVELEEREDLEDGYWRENPPKQFENDATGDSPLRDELPVSPHEDARDDSDHGNSPGQLDDDDEDDDEDDDFHDNSDDPLMFEQVAKQLEEEGKEWEELLEEDLEKKSVLNSHTNPVTDDVGDHKMAHSETPVEPTPPAANERESDYKEDSDHYKDRQDDRIEEGGAMEGAMEGNDNDTNQLQEDFKEREAENGGELFEEEKDKDHEDEPLRRAPEEEKNSADIPVVDFGEQENAKEGSVEVPPLTEPSVEKASSTVPQTLLSTDEVNVAPSPASASILLKPTEAVDTHKQFKENEGDIRLEEDGDRIEEEVRVTEEVPVTTPPHQQAQHDLTTDPSTASSVEEPLVQSHVPPVTIQSSAGEEFLATIFGDNKMSLYALLGTLAAILFPCCLMTCRWSQASASYKKEVQKVTVRCRGAEEKVAKLEKERNDLLINFNAEQGQRTSVEEQLMTEQHQVMQYQQNCNELNAQVMAMQAQLQHYQGQLDQLSGELITEKQLHGNQVICTQEAEKEIQATRAQLQQVATQVAELEAVKDQLEHDVYTSKQSLNQLQDTHLQLKQTHDENNQRCNRAEVELVDTRGRLDTMEGTLNDKEEELKLLRDCLQQLESDGSEDEEEIAESTQQNGGKKALKRTNSKLERIHALLDTAKVQMELKEVKEEKDSLQKQFESQARTTRKLEGELWKAKNDVEKLQAENDQVAHQHSEVEVKLQTLTEYFEHKEQNLHRKLGVEEAARQEIATREATAKEKVSQAEGERVKERAELQQLREQMMEIEKSLKQQVLTNEKRAQEALAQLHRTEQDLRSANREVGILKKRLNEGSRPTSPPGMVHRPPPNALPAHQRYTPPLPEQQYEPIPVRRRPPSAGPSLDKMGRPPSAPRFPHAPSPNEFDYPQRPVARRPPPPHLNDTYPGQQSLPPRTHASLSLDDRDQPPYRPDDHKSYPPPPMMIQQQRPDRNMPPGPPFISDRPPIRGDRPYRHPPPARPRMGPPGPRPDVPPSGMLTMKPPLPHHPMRFPPPHEDPSGHMQPPPPLPMGSSGELRPNFPTGTAKQQNKETV